MYVAGNHNIIENCQFYNNRDTGLQIGRAYSDQTSIDMWPSYNLIKNCTSFANYDDVTYGENADGYAAKLTVGYGNVFDGCIAFRNSDDGWDLFAKVDSGDIGTVVLYNCVSFENGFLPYKNDNKEDSKAGTYDTLNGDGIGFKLGGSIMKGNVIVNNCLAFNNKLHGVGDNSNPGVISVHNFTAFNNCAGVDGDGKIRPTRGLDGIANKSNNIDLARSTNSYNNYYGIVSYINNQKDFKNDNDSEYNLDAFRGSTAYSIFNTGYKDGEIYTTFTGYEDASSWATDTVDTAYSSGTKYEGMSDAVFKDLTAINAVCDGREKLTDLLDIHKEYRNDDKSVNMKDKIRIVDEKLLKYADGKPIGAQLSKESYADYDHYGMYTFMEDKAANYSTEEVAVLAAYSITEVIANTEAVYQSFIVPKQIAGADISWKSANESVLVVDNNETKSRSQSVFSRVDVIVPDKDTKVKLTATISIEDVKVEKEFELTVKGRTQTLGDMESTGSSAIRVNLYGVYTAPRVYALDASAITVSEFPASAYTLTNTYRYATDGNSKFYNIDGVYTSVAGVYEVTVTAALKSNPDVTSSLVYKVYVVDPDANIDFINGESTIALSSTGFDISGNLSNIEGSVVAITSRESKTFTNAQELLAEPNLQEVKILTDSITAPFIADNSSDTGSSTQYYIYYAVVNGNKSANTNSNTVYSEQITVKDVSTKEQFESIARKGVLPDETSSSATTIYSLTTDLDFTGYEWSTVDKDGAKAGTFKGLFRGNNKTIKNITAAHMDGSSAKSVNIFFKVSNGTVMDVKFDNIKLEGNDDSKQVGIIGELLGGYVHNVKATNVAAKGKESVGAIIGQVTGGANTVTNCSLVNPVNDKKTLEEVNAANNYKIQVKNKYAGGIIGNAQKNNELEKSLDFLTLNISNCFVDAIIGDGNDAAGNVGSILGRCKNDLDTYNVNITQCVAYGLLVSKGQYSAGIVGDFDNGVGHIYISKCFADVTFIYSEMYLNAKEEYLKDAECQKYAHKNSNPIVGRAVANTGFGEYVTASNMGSWQEYYSSYVSSSSLIFDLSNYDETGEFFTISQALAESFFGYDFTNTWKFENGKIILR